MAGAGISPSTNTTNIEPSPSNEDDEHEHLTNHDGNDDESQDVGSHESSEPVVVSPARTPTEEDEEDGDDDDNELFIHAAAKEVPPLFPKEKETPSKTATSISISIPSFTKAGLSKKATPLALESWAALSLTLDGRDKLTKVFQYATRLLGWWDQDPFKMLPNDS
jgi:hypothetical protein